jgi:hypothetical protein
MEAALALAAREAAEIQQREEAKRRYKIQLAEAEVKQMKGEKDLTGWITLQSRDEVSWKRRYFKFVQVASRRNSGPGISSQRISASVPG